MINLSFVSIKKRPSYHSRQLGYLLAQKYLTPMRPVAFRHPISRILAFSWIDKESYQSTFVAKITPNSED
jgi:hypothetical protein